MSKEMKILPELRFPDFTNNDQWKADTVQNIVTTKSPPKKLQSSEYLDEGVFPIIDQSQSFYCGYTNDQHAIINEDLPLVIFGDHTCSLKMAREPFAQGADGIKILKSKAFIDPEYLYQYLTYNGVKQENYKRHYSKLKEKIVPYPEFESGEQQKIASCLSSLDELIAAHKDKLEALKDHKKGLLQNLFPQEGENVPKVRFSEFTEPLQHSFYRDLGSIKIGLTHKPDYISSGIPFLSSKNISAGFIDFENIQYISQEKFDSMPDSTKPKVGDILFTRVGSNLGNPIILEHNIEFGIFVSLGFFRVNKKANNRFIKHWMESDYFWKQVNQKVAGGAKNNLNSTWLKEFELYIPSIKEQEKIATTLDSVDELIRAQIEKIEELNQHKRGLMQGLFPKIKS